MVADLLSGPSSSGSSSGSTSGTSGSGLCQAGGGFYPDAGAMLRQQGLLVA